MRKSPHYDLNQQFDLNNFCTMYQLVASDVPDAWGPGTPQSHYDRHVRSKVLDSASQADGPSATHQGGDATPPPGRWRSPRPPCTSRRRFQAKTRTVSARLNKVGTLWAERAGLMPARSRKGVAWAGLMPARSRKGVAWAGVVRRKAHARREAAAAPRLGVV